MALFSKCAITEKGKALIAKCQTTGEGIEFTKGVTGSGSHENEGTEELEVMTALKEPQAEFAISDLAVSEDDDKTAVITVVINNRGLENLYYLNEFGLYAKDEDEGEILYAVLASEEQMIYIPPDNGQEGISTVTVRVHIAVVNAGETKINTTGGVVSATDFAELRKLVMNAVTGLKGGTTGQMLTKNSVNLFDYSWKDINTITGAMADFPKAGRKNAVYIDTDSCEIYVWKVLDDGKEGYFKLPLGSEASATLQKQITANFKNISDIKKDIKELQDRFLETELLVKESEWTQAIEDGIMVFRQEIAVEGMTADTPGTLYPKVKSQKAAEIVEEMKASSTFFGRGITDTEDGKIVLRCYKKKPGCDFGAVFQGDTDPKGVSEE